MEAELYAEEPSLWAPGNDEVCGSPCAAILESELLQEVLSVVLLKCDEMPPLVLPHVCGPFPLGLSHSIADDVTVAWVVGSEHARVPPLDTAVLVVLAVLLVVPPMAGDELAEWEVFVLSSAVFLKKQCCKAW